jgi:hypothetical protein
VLIVLGLVISIGLAMKSWLSPSSDLVARLEQENGEYGGNYYIAVENRGPTAEVWADVSIPSGYPRQQWEPSNPRREFQS